MAASIVYALHENTKSGHCYCKLDAIEGTILHLIKDIEVTPEIIADKLVELIKNGMITILDGTDVYLTQFLEEEKHTAKMIKNLLKDPAPLYNRNYVDECLCEATRVNGYELEEMQKEAVHCSLRKCFSVITGGPGTGKTSVIKTVINSFIMMGGKKKNVILAAPTGRASRRMYETTGFPAHTVASLCMKMKIRLEDDEVDRDRYLVIIDEASMIDISLAHNLMCCIAALRKNCKGVQVIMVGDIDQLPPIGAGNFFRDLVKSPAIPTTTLTFSHRFKGAIAINASRVNHGSGVASFELDNSFRYTKTDKATSQDAVIKAYLEARDRYQPKDIQIIVPMKTRSTTAANELNCIIRDIVNPAEKTEVYNITGRQKDFRVNDRVMQTVNDRDLGISNGDCGTVTGIEDGCLVVEFDDGKTVEFTVKSAESLVLAYAITIHKSQGSEYECVITCFTNEHYVMLQRNLIYTAFSRAKRK